MSQSHGNPPSLHSSSQMLFALDHGDAPLTTSYTNPNVPNGYSGDWRQSSQAPPPNRHVRPTGEKSTHSRSRTSSTLSLRNTSIAQSTGSTVSEALRPMQDLPFLGLEVDSIAAFVESSVADALKTAQSESESARRKLKDCAHVPLVDPGIVATDSRLTTSAGPESHSQCSIRSEAVALLTTPDYAGVPSGTFTPLFLSQESSKRASLDSTPSRPDDTSAEQDVRSLDSYERFINQVYYVKSPNKARSQARRSIELPRPPVTETKAPRANKSPSPRPKRYGRDAFTDETLSDATAFLTLSLGDEQHSAAVNSTEAQESRPTIGESPAGIESEFAKRCASNLSVDALPMVEIRRDTDCGTQQDQKYAIACPRVTNGSSPDRTSRTHHKAISPAILLEKEIENARAVVAAYKEREECSSAPVRDSTTVMGASDQPTVAACGASSETPSTAEPPRRWCRCWWK